MSARAMRALVAKEARALLPTWAAAVGALAATALATGEAHRFGLLAFVVATAALGAHSLGHEYGCRTLDVMLTLPIARSRLLLVKLGVLAALVLPLSAAAYALRLFADEVWLAWLLGGATLAFAPALTMLCRSQLAGLVFSLSVPGATLVLLMLVTGTPLDEPAPLVLWRRVMIVAVPVGAVVMWRAFLRLESIDGSSPLLDGISWRRRRVRATPGRPLWQLLKKELRLQQMTLAITAIYIAVCIAEALVHLPRLGRTVSFAGAVTVFYELGVSVLVGSLATAEERQLGTLSWQLQLPIPRWQQWAVKVATVFAVTLVMSVFVPAVAVPAIWPAGRPVVEMPIILAVAITALSMYVSSVCATTVRAVVASVATLSFVLWLALAPAVWSGLARGSVVLLSMVSAVLVGFAFLNHRSEPPPAWRVCRQAASAAILLALGLFVV